MLLSFGVAVGILFSFALELAIFRTYFELEDDPAGQREYVDSVWRFLIATSLVGAVILSAIAWPLVGHGRAGGLDVALAFVGALAVSSTTLPLAVLRAEQRLRDYLKVTAVTMIASPLLTVVFVVVLDGGIRGWLVAMVLSSMLALAAAMWVLPWRPRTPFNAQMVRRSVIFSIPLLPHMLSHWALQSADRGVLAGIVSPNALGIYSLAANMSLPLMIVLSSLNQGFMPTYARAAWNSEARGGLERVVVLQASLVVAACLAGALLGPPLVDVMAAASYSGAAALVPWLVLGYGFLGLYYIPMNAATLIAGRSRFAWVATASSAAANIGLLFLLVPAHGIRAAAIASAAGYLILLVMMSVYARPNPIRYRWDRILPVVVAAAALYVLAQSTTPSDPILALAVRTLWLLALLGGLAAMGILPLRRVRSARLDQ